MPYKVEVKGLGLWIFGNPEKPTRLKEGTHVVEDPDVVEAAKRFKSIDKNVFVKVTDTKDKPTDTSKHPHQYYLPSEEQSVNETELGVFEPAKRKG